MNQHTTEKMKEMKFYGMLRAFQTNLESGKMNDLTSDEMIALLINEEWDDRYNRKIARNMKNAKFRYSASIEQMHFDANRNLDKNLVKRLAECIFIDKMENVLITGSTGIGNSYLASALNNWTSFLLEKVWSVLYCLQNFKMTFEVRLNKLPGIKKPILFFTSYS